jgi:hypothetical protein
MKKIRRKLLVAFLLLCFLVVPSKSVFASDQNIYLGGMPIGFSIMQRGAEVVGLTDVLTENGTCSPAKDAGIKAGDLILSINGVEVNDAKDLTKTLTNCDSKEIVIDRKGEEIVLPFLGLNTVQHIHAYDLAQIIYACIQKQDVSNGEAFIAVAERAMTLRAICEELYAHYGQKPNLRFVEWAEFEKIVGKENADVTLDHATHSPCCSVEKAKQLLGVEIKYSIMDIFKEYLQYQGM